MPKGRLEVDRYNKTLKKEEDTVISDCGKLKLTIGSEIDAAPVVPSIALKRSERKGFFEESHDKIEKSDLVSATASKAVHKNLFTLEEFPSSSELAELFTGNPTRAVTNNTLLGHASDSPANICDIIEFTRYCSSSTGMFVDEDVDTELAKFLDEICLTGESLI